MNKDQMHGLAVLALMVATTTLGIWSIVTVSFRLAVAALITASAINVVAMSWDSHTRRLRKGDAVREVANILYKSNPDTHPQSAENFMLASEQAREVVDALWKTAPNREAASRP